MRKKIPPAVAKHIKQDAYITNPKSLGTLLHRVSTVMLLMFFLTFGSTLWFHFFQLCMPITHVVCSSQSEGLKAFAYRGLINLSEFASLS